MYVSNDDVERFQRDGAVVLRNVFTEDWVDKVCKGIAQNLASPSEYAECLRGTGGPGAYFNDYCNWMAIPEFRDYVYNSPAAQISARVMQSTVSSSQKTSS